MAHRRRAGQWPAEGGRSLTTLRTLYVSHNSVGSALVRGQVLTYLRGLEPYGIEAELATFERGDEFPRGEFPRERWHPLYAQTGSSLAAKAIDVLRGVALTVGLVRRHDLALIHARSYVPAAVAMIAGILTRRPYIFDMRGFLGDEYVDAGYWQPGELRYRVLRVAERSLLARASHIVVLTDAAVRALRTDTRWARATRSKPITTIPCAVDLKRFRPFNERAATPTLIYTGSLGSLYALDVMLAVYRKARSLVPGLRFLIVNRGEHALVREAITAHQITDNDIELRSADFGEMPGLVAGAHVGIALMRRSPSKVASSPVKIAEYLACALPVVVNAGLGDVDVQVRDNGAGHVMAAYDEGEIGAAAKAVARLIDDVEARARARELAEREYDLDAAIARYADVYRAVADVHS
jgi:glycosyltransferase involved in cell wall biosynthesis